MMFLPNSEARRFSSLQVDLWTIIRPVIGSLKPTTLSPGSGLQQLAIVNLSPLMVLSVCEVDGSSVSVSLLESRHNFQNFSILLAELDLIIFSKLSSEIIPAPILLYSSSLYLQPYARITLRSTLPLSVMLNCASFSSKIASPWLILSSRSRFR